MTKDCKLPTRIGRALRRFAGSASGSIAIEFAAVAPIFVLILAMTVDSGLVLRARFNLDTAVSSSAGFAIINGSNIGAAGSAKFAEQLATIVPKGYETKVVVNNASTVSRTAAAASASASGNTANAENCYCPAGAGASLTWGSAAVCKTPCANGGQAGKFVVIRASVNYSPMFFDYGLISEGKISSEAVVQIQ